MKRRPKNVTIISQYPNEKEFLLNCFSVFKIFKINFDYDGYLLYEMNMI